MRFEQGPVTSQPCLKLSAKQETVVHGAGRKHSFFESQSDSLVFPRDSSLGRKLGLGEEGFWPLFCFNYRSSRAGWIAMRQLL